MPPKSSFSPHAIPPIEHNKNRIPPRPTPFSHLQRKAITGPNTIHKKSYTLHPFPFPSSSSQPSPRSYKAGAKNNRHRQQSLPNFTCFSLFRFPAKKMPKIRSQKQRRQGEPSPPTRPPMQAVFLREGRELERTRSVSHKNSLSPDKSVTLGGERRAEGPEGKKEKRTFTTVSRGKKLGYQKEQLQLAVMKKQWFASEN